ncbi:hypothetical protein AN958_08659 [Leucoagaricus sp. SymC.cos]|nr:hypothetical protein AN958_08659 [Leucoagaricus sp. SymC.cos]
MTEGELCGVPSGYGDRFEPMLDICSSLRAQVRILLASRILFSAQVQTLLASRFFFSPTLFSPSKLRFKLESGLFADTHLVLFHANVEWWRKALVSLVDSGAQYELDADSSTRIVLQADCNLLEHLKAEKIGKPLALGAVINELRSSQVLIPLPEFISRRVSIYDPGWLPYRIASFVVGKPLWWALKQVGIVGDEGYLSSESRQKDWFGEYVFVGLVERAADAVIAMQEARMTGPADALYTLDDFRKSFAPIFGLPDRPILSEIDARIILKHLERERGAIVVDDEVIKFVDKNIPSEDRLITAVDRGIVELKSAISNMQRTVETLQQKIDEYTKKAATALNQKQKPLALNYLRSRKRLEEVLNKRLASLGILEGTMISVETAAGDVQIMKSYEASTSTLRTILSHPSLQRTNIDKTMDALAEANYNAREIDDAIRIGGDAVVGTDVDEELEAEWKALVHDVETTSQSARTLEQLQVPRIAPKSSEASYSEKKVLVSPS